MVAIVVNHKMVIRVKPKWGKETITSLQWSIARSEIDA